MLRTRVVTAIALLAVLLAVLWSGSFAAFAVVALAFFAAAAWEGFRLFGSRRPAVPAVLWTVAMGLVLTLTARQADLRVLYALCVAIWAIRLSPTLGVGLPPLASGGNRLLAGVYTIALLGCFGAIAGLFLLSPVYLLSVMAIVWIADIGAYFAGKRFGRRKLAPAISPGKSWEGAVGGLLAVLLVGAACAAAPALQGTFPARLRDTWGWGGFVLVMTLLVAASVAGDLFESQLKRRAGMKDSSALLPGHGGVLDRIDALVPVLPVAMLLTVGF
ncbi:MAG: phosphatidate cytidylyltransferase [Burkholderiaceae bacterium]